MIQLLSPAKINLFLAVTGKRSDGYHELASLFQAIDLFDRLSFAFSDEDQLTCTDEAIPTDGRNLVFKAAEVFRKRTNLRFSFNIHIDKFIPSEAGLGGGSSNAATALWGLNKLLNCPASLDDLVLCAAEIGSDVPFFLSEGTAFCTGRGEVLQKLNQLPRQMLTIVKPSKGLSTQLVYKKLEIDRAVRSDPATILNSFLEAKPTYFNDLEASAFKLMPELANLKSELLSRGFTTVLMSGSGTAFFCLGNGNTHGIEGVKSFSASFTNRESNCWY